MRPQPIPLQDPRGLSNCSQKNPYHDTIPLLISLQIEASLDAVEKMLNDLSRSHYWTRAREAAPSLIAAYSDKEKFMQVISVADPHHLDADPDSTFHPDADPDPDPDPSFTKRLKHLKKVIK